MLRYSKILSEHFFPARFLVLSYDDAMRARHCCHSDEARLLQGASSNGQSAQPILAYFAHIDVWTTIATICKANGYTLTVYIDDVTISGASVSAKVLWEIKKAIHRAGHRYHKEKLFVDGPAEITGVMVIGNTLVPPNRQHRKIRQSTKALKAPLSVEATRELENRLIGLRSQLRQIRKEAGSIVSEER